jgi:hypothetical protein
LECFTFLILPFWWSKSFLCLDAPLYHKIGKVSWSYFIEYIIPAFRWYLFSFLYTQEFSVRSLIVSHVLCMFCCNFLCFNISTISSLASTQFSTHLILFGKLVDEHLIWLIVFFILNTPICYLKKFLYLSNGIHFDSLSKPTMVSILILPISQSLFGSSFQLLPNSPLCLCQFSLYLVHKYGSKLAHFFLTWSYFTKTYYLHFHSFSYK